MDESPIRRRFEIMFLVVGGVVAVVLALWRSIIAERQSRTSHQTFLNESYQRGAEMFGSDVISVRLGGIYALERVASEHPYLYHVQITKLFSTFARHPTVDRAPEITRSRRRGVPRKRREPQSTSPQLREDVQAIMSAIGTPWRNGPRHREGAEFHPRPTRCRLVVRPAFGGEPRTGQSLSGQVALC